MKQGLYKTKAGSMVSVQGKYDDIYHIDFDWVEEDACSDCRPTVHDGYLEWDCDYHEGGSAQLTEAE